MATGIVTWSTTASNNANADSSVNMAEGMAPSAVNDSCRGMMASVAKWLADNNGSLTTGGTSTAYTVTTNQGFASLTAGLALRLKFHAVNGPAPTLAVDGLTAKTIVPNSALANLSDGWITLGGIHDVIYNGTNWVLCNIGGLPPFPSGTVMLFQQTAAPTGWTKSTTHNDKALRIVSGTAGSGGSTAFTSIFAARTIAQVNLPNITLTTNISDPGHSHALDVYDASGPANTAAGAAIADAHVLKQSGTSTTGITASTPLGGSGTAMDFAVQYVDVIAATKD